MSVGDRVLSVPVSVVSVGDRVLSVPVRVLCLLVIGCCLSH